MEAPNGSFQPATTRLFDSHQEDMDQIPLRVLDPVPIDNDGDVSSMECIPSETQSFTDSDIEEGYGPSSYRSNNRVAARKVARHIRGYHLFQNRWVQCICSNCTARQAAVPLRVFTIAMILLAIPYTVIVTKVLGSLITLLGQYADTAHDRIGVVLHFISLGILAYAVVSLYQLWPRNQDVQEREETPQLRNASEYRDECHED